MTAIIAALLLAALGSTGTAPPPDTGSPAGDERYDSPTGGSPMTADSDESDPPVIPDPDDPAALLSLAGRLVEQGDGEAALATLDRLDGLALTEPERQRVAFVRGLALLARGLAAEAAALLAVATDLSGLPEDHRLHQLALAFERAGSSERAIPLWRRLLDRYRKDSIHSTTALAGLLRALAGNGRTAELKAFLTPGRIADLAPSGSPGHAQVRLAQARLALKTDGAARARELLRSIVLDHARDPAAIEAGEELLRLSAAGESAADADLPATLGALNEGWFLERASALCDRHLPAAARARPADTGLLLACGRIRSHLRDWPGALAVYRDALSLARTPEAEIPSRRGIARVLSRTGDAAGAAAEFQAVARLVREPEDRFQSLLSAAIETANAGMPDGALHQLDELLRSVPRTGDRRHHAVLWFSGIYQYMAGRPRDAHDRFRQLCETDGTSIYRTGCPYWQARSLEAAGAREKAIEGYRRIAGGAPLRYYAVLARQRLAGLVADSQAAATRPEMAPFDPLLDTLLEPSFASGLPGPDEGVTPAVLAEADAQIAAARVREDLLWRTVSGFDEQVFDRGFLHLSAATGLARSGLRRAAVDELAAFTAELRSYRRGVAGRGRSADPATRQRWQKIRKRAAGTDLQPLHQAMRDLFLIHDRPGLAFRLDSLQPAAGLTETERLRRQYPVFYAQAVAERAAAAGIPFPLVAAILRTESGYDTAAVSQVSAMGLMQLMPQTARRIHQRLHGVPREFLNEELIDVDLNIRYGVWYLGELSRMFNGQAPLVAAAYNGGPFNVERWLSRYGHLPWDLFIETIPFSQTRGYVKEVIRVMYAYSVAYGAGRDPFDFTAPIGTGIGYRVDY